MRRIRLFITLFAFFFVVIKNGCIFAADLWKDLDCLQPQKKMLKLQFYFLSLFKSLHFPFYLFHINSLNKDGLFIYIRIRFGRASR